MDAAEVVAQDTKEVLMTLHPDRRCPHCGGPDIDHIPGPKTRTVCCRECGWCGLPEELYTAQDFADDAGDRLFHERVDARVTP
jgi:hypothetical protein